MSLKNKAPSLRISRVFIYNTIALFSCCSLLMPTAFQPSSIMLRGVAHCSAYLLSCFLLLSASHYLKNPVLLLLTVPGHGHGHILHHNTPCTHTHVKQRYNTATSEMADQKLKFFPVTSASLLSHSSSRVVEVFDRSRKFLGASISEKNDKADNVGDTETNSQGL